MEITTFLASVEEKAPPENISLHLESLWWDAKGNWEKAHHIADRVLADQEGDWIHAYLHRKEGDSFNAGYWYNRASKPHFSGSLEAEWRELVLHFLPKD